MVSGRLLRIPGTPETGLNGQGFLLGKMSLVELGEAAWRGWPPPLGCGEGLTLSEGERVRRFSGGCVV